MHYWQRRKICCINFEIKISKIETKKDYKIQKHFEGSYFGKLKVSDCIINKNFTCQQAYNLIRAVSFPYFGARYNNLIIWKAIKDDNLKDEKVLVEALQHAKTNTYLLLRCLLRLVLWL